MTVPPLLTEADRSLRQRLRAAFTEHLGLKAVALLLAVLLWLIVGARGLDLRPSSLLPRGEREAVSPVRAEAPR